MLKLNKKTRSFLETTLNLQETITSLIVIGEDASLEEVLLALVAERYCEKHEILATESEIEDAILQIRKDQRLITQQDTLNWLSVTGISDDELRQQATKLVKLNLFKDAITGAEEIERYFAFNRLKFDEVELYKIVLASSAAARELRAQVLEGESFFELAQKYSIDQATRVKCGYIGRVRREKLAAEVQSHVFTKEPAKIIGPFKIASHHHLYRVEGVFRAELSDAVRDEIAELLLSNWLLNSLEDWLESGVLRVKQ
jgi:parvulin-like peptidyl-prolyl isomerase